MDDIVQRIQALQDSYDKHYRLEEEYRQLFKLAGYDLYHREEREDGTELSAPKDIKELIAEALGNPPTESPGKWIRISDIPNYIQQYLIVPAHEDLEYFNDKNSKKPSPVADKSEIKDEEEDPVFVNESGEQEDFEFTGNEWQKASLIPNDTTFVDSTGVVWYKVESNRIAHVAEFDPQKPDYYFNADVSGWPPLREIKYNA